MKFHIEMFQFTLIAMTRLNDSLVEENFARAFESLASNSSIVSSLTKIQWWIFITENSGWKKMKIRDEFCRAGPVGPARPSRFWEAYNSETVDYTEKKLSDIKCLLTL